MGELITKATEETTSAKNLAALIPRGVWTSIGEPTKINMADKTKNIKVTTPGDSETQVSEGAPRSGAGGAPSLASYSTQNPRNKPGGTNKPGGEKRPRNSSSEELSPQSKAEEKQRKLRLHKTRKVLETDKPHKERSEGKSKAKDTQSADSKKLRKLYRRLR